MKYFFLIIITFFSISAFGQTVSVSDDLSIRNDLQYELIGKLKDRFLVFRDKGNEYKIQAFDERLRTSWSKKLELDKKRVHIAGLITTKDRFHLFYAFKKKGKYYLKAHTYDAGANMIDSTTVWEYGAQFYPPTPQLVPSMDKSKLLIFQIERQTKVEAMGFDLEKMEILWDIDFEPTAFNIYRDHMEILMNNKGRGYFMVGKDNRKARKEDHHFLIYQLDKEMTAPSLGKIHMTGKMTYDVLFEYDDLNQRLVAGGFFSEKSRGRTNGFFYLNINPNNIDDHSLTFQDFDKQFMSKIMEKKLDQEVKGVVDVGVKEIILRRDGGIILMAERKRQTERRMASSGRGYIGRDGSRYIIDFYNEDIFATSIHPDGELHWQTILHKKQYSQDDDAVFSSYFLMKTPAALRLLFNDEIRHENTVSEYILDGNGDFDRNSVMNTDDQEIRLRFQDAVQINSKECIIPSEHRHRLRLVKVSYK